jgi:hypothetical protein
MDVADGRVVVANVTMVFKRHVRSKAHFHALCRHNRLAQNLTNSRVSHLSLNNSIHIENLNELLINKKPELI